MERRYVKGKTLNEQLDRIDKTLQHFSGRLSHKVVGLVPAAPVFDFVFAPDPDGVVLRRIFPVEGRITKSCIFVAHHGSKGPTVLRLSIMRGGRETTERLEVGKIPLLLDLGMPIKGGDLLVLSVDDPEEVKGIWIGFLYEIDVKGMGKKDFVLDQIEELMVKEEEEDACESQEG